jgi:hypothetical protein
VGRSRRGRACALGVAVASLVLLQAVPGAAADGGIELVVSTTPGGPPTRALNLPIRSRDTSGSLTFFLREVAGRAVPGVVLYAAAPAGLSIAFARPGGQAPAAALTLDLAEGAFVDITTTGTWDDYGTAEVPLLAQTQGSVSTLAVIRVNRPGGPPLTVVGAVPGTGLAIASTGPALTTSITIATGDHPAAVIVATVSDLRDAASGTRYAVAEPRVEIDDMEANSTAVVPLDAELPYAGTFTGILRLAHDGIADPPVALAITRTLGASGVTIDSVQTSSSAFDGWAVDTDLEWSWDTSVRSALEGHQEVTRSVVLLETAGTGAHLDAPVFVKASAKRGEETTGDADVKVVSTTLAPEQPDCDLQDTGGITIAPGRQCRLEITLDVPAEPGQYDGALRFTQPGYTPVETPMTLHLRRGLLTAILVIGFGLVLGYLLKDVLARRRARLERLSKVARLARELEQRVAGLPGGLRDDGERRAHAGMRLRLSSIADEPGTDVGGATDIDEKLAAMRKLVPVLVPWVLLRRAALDASPPAQAAVIRRIDAIGVALAGAHTSEDEANELPGQIDELEKELRGRITELVRNEIDRVKEEVGTWFAVAERTAIDQQFERASDLVAGDQGAPELAERELAIAQGMAARAMSARIYQLLDAPSPVAMEPGAWAQLQMQVRAALAGVRAKDPDGAMEAVRDADYVLLAGLVGAVTDKVTRTRDDYAATGSPAHQERVAALDGILEHLDEARTALGHGDLATAHAAYDRARAGLAQAHTKGFLAGTAAQGAAAPPALPRPPDSAGVAAPAVPASSFDPVIDLSDVQAQWDRYQKGLFVLTLVVGTAVGVLALYVGKPTWGSLGDILIAILWGVGLWQASGAVAQGWGGVRTALTT